MKLLNAVKYCGVDSWEVGKKVDVLNVDCAGVTRRQGEVIFDVYRLSNKNKEIRFGKESFFMDRSAADARPVSINDPHVFRRQ